MKKLMVLLLTTVIFIGCGEEKKEQKIKLGDYDNSKMVENTTSEEVNDNATLTNNENDMDDQNSEMVEVRIEGNDKMQFNKDKITVPSGKTIKLTLVHVGELPEKVMGHNVVILKKGTDVQKFATEAINFANNNYVPKNAENVIAHTEIIGGGESTTIEFEAPEPGTYTFICSFPGHYVNMQGAFVVE